MAATKTAKKRKGKNQKKQQKSISNPVDESEDATKTSSPVESTSSLSAATGDQGEAPSDQVDASEPQQDLPEETADLTKNENDAVSNVSDATDAAAPPSSNLPDTELKSEETELDENPASNSGVKTPQMKETDSQTDSVPEIPQLSVARSVDPENIVMLEAKRQVMSFAKPVVVKDINLVRQEPSSDEKAESSGDSDGHLNGTTHELEAQDNGPNPSDYEDDGDFDPDLYFSGPEDVVVAKGTSAEDTHSVDSFSDGAVEPLERAKTVQLKFAGSPVALDAGFKTTNISENSGSPVATETPVSDDTSKTFKDKDDENLEDREQQQHHNRQSSNVERISGEYKSPNIDSKLAGEENEITAIDHGHAENKETAEASVHDNNNNDNNNDTESEKAERERAQPGMIRRVNPEQPGFTPLQSPLASPLGSPLGSPKNKRLSTNSEDDQYHNHLSPSSHTNPAKTRGAAVPTINSMPALDLPHPSSTADSNIEIGSPTDSSPRQYKYVKSPLPSSPMGRPEPPIFGVCVVGFHHKRGPEVEYWVGPKESRSNMWPYLPFQSLPDGSHQFEENICYFTLLYDRLKRASTSLTFSRDEDGHIQKDTSDFRDATTLFAIACSRQVPLSELEHVTEDEEYTRSIVQKSVVVIASKPIFGPIKEKLTVVTRSFFQQRNFNDRTIIDHFYENLVQMPLWANDNDSQVGMNLQRCVHDFGVNTLTILKAMLLELKILFYSNDTDVLGTTQFALISLVPNLINNLEDCGSPLLSSYELKLQPAHTLKDSDRASLLNYVGFPLQLFAGGGVFAPFVPLQQFDDLKQPETRYGMFGTANNLFLTTELDFDLVVNVDTHELDIRSQEAAALLKLTEEDRAFAQDVTTAVNNAWDSEDRWQPQALGYYGGEDYIRHQYEEYLIALLASAKHAKSLKVAASTDIGSPNQTNSAPEEKEALSVMQPWGKAWAEKWIHTTNNFRIFDQHSDDEMYKVIGTKHPGQKLRKPSGFQRFLGFFRAKPGPATETKDVNSQSADNDSFSTRSEPQTPNLTTEGKFETPGGYQESNASPRSWFRR